MDGEITSHWWRGWLAAFHEPGGVEGVLDCAGRAPRRRRFRADGHGPNQCEPSRVRKRSRAPLATAVQDARGLALGPGRNARFHIAVARHEPKRLN